MATTRTRARTRARRGGAPTAPVTVGQVARLDPSVQAALQGVGCDDVLAHKGARIGSESMHAEVYAVPKHPHLVLKLVPYTRHSQNEAKKLLDFTLRTVRERLQHFPVTYGVHVCPRAIGAFANAELLRDAFDDMDPINAQACAEYMRRNLRRALAAAPLRLPPMLRRLADGDDDGGASVGADAVARRWRAFKALGIAEDRDYGDVRTIAIFAERADADLGALLASAERSPAEVASLLYQVTVALGYMDRPEVGGYAHGDLHAGNVLVRALEAPTTLAYPDAQGHCARLGPVREYAVLWDLETVAPASPADGHTVVDDMKRLFASLNGNAAIRARQPPDTRRLLALLDRRAWTSLPQIAAYLTRPSLRAGCAPAPAPAPAPASASASAASSASPTSARASRSS